MKPVSPGPISCYCSHKFIHKICHIILGFFPESKCVKIYVSPNNGINGFITVEFKWSFVNARGIYLQQQFQHYKSACSFFSAEYVTVNQHFNFASLYALQCRCFHVIFLPDQTPKNLKQGWPQFRTCSIVTRKHFCFPYLRSILEGEKQEYKDQNL